MTLDQLLLPVVIGAGTAFAAVLAWSIRETVALGRVVSGLKTDVESIKSENATCAAQREAINTGMATLLERSSTHTSALQEIKDWLSPRPTRRPRARAAGG